MIIYQITIILNKLSKIFDVNILSINYVCVFMHINEKISRNIIKISTAFPFIKEVIYKITV